MSSLLDQALVALEGSNALLLALKISVALALGLTACALLPRAKASTRHFVLAMSFSALLIIPAADLLRVDALTIESPGQTQAEAMATNRDATAAVRATTNSSQTDKIGKQVGAESTATLLGARTSPETESVVAVTSTSTNAISSQVLSDTDNASTGWTSITIPHRLGSAVGTVGFLIWLVGAGLFLTLLFIDFLKLARIRRGALPALDLKAVVDELSKEVGIARSISVMVHEELVGPLTCGIVEPAIVLPPAALEWEQQDLRRALVHEIEHVRRNDWSTQLFARVVISLYWFHPLVWRAWRRLRVEAERAADDAVLRSPIAASATDQGDTGLVPEHAVATDYADQLVALAKGSSARESMVLGMANRSDLSVRVRALLNGNQPRGRQAARTVCLALLGAAISVGALAPLRVEAGKRSILKDTKPSAHLDELAVDGIATDPDKPTGELSAGKLGVTQLAALNRELIEAADDGRLVAVRELIESGADVNVAIETEGSPLIAAARRGHQDIIKMLLTRGADPNLAVRYDGNPLIMAAKFGRRQAVETLLTAGARIDEVVPGDENALISASASGQLDVVQLLIRRGADVNAKAWAAGAGANGEWRTAIKMARRADDNSIVETLQAAGATE